MKSISILSKEKKNNSQNNKLSDQQFKYSYSIIPTNFINLSEEHQAQKLGQFNDILRVIEDRIKITMSRRLVPITVEGQITEMPVMQVHLESHQPLSDILDQIKLEYISGDRPPKNKIVKENLSNIKIQDNENSVFAQCFTLHGLPASLPYAWITNIFQLCSQVQILINPVPKDESITRMVRFKNIIYEDSKKDRATAELYKQADDTENSLRRDDTGLYECIINCVITAPDKKTLHANSKLFKKQVKRHGGLFAAVSANRPQCYSKIMAKNLLWIVEVVPFFIHLSQLICWRFQTAFHWEST
ncbi:hypothetical protein [Nitrosopumilus sp.]|uniref:hypothetical protein n=1 Tax=Nitrosopumilus sp. TaxID=2024843 RepID=UPI00292FC128|nr:hypothetical protein [Nitrosopumilus sp.]